MNAEGTGTTAPTPDLGWLVVGAAYWLFVGLASLGVIFAVTPGIFLSPCVLLLGAWPAWPRSRWPGLLLIPAALALVGATDGGFDTVSIVAIAASTTTAAAALWAVYRDANRR